MASQDASQEEWPAPPPPVTAPVTPSPPPYSLPQSTVASTAPVTPPPPPPPVITPPQPEQPHSTILSPSAPPFQPSRVLPNAAVSLYPVLTSQGTFYVPRPSRSLPVMFSGDEGAGWDTPDNTAWATTDLLPTGGALVQGIPSNPTQQNLGPSSPWSNPPSPALNPARVSTSHATTRKTPKYQPIHNPDLAYHNKSSGDEGNTWLSLPNKGVEDMQGQLNDSSEDEKKPQYTRDKRGRQGRGLGRLPTGKYHSKKRDSEDSPLNYVNFTPQQMQAIIATLPDPEQQPMPFFRRMQQTQLTYAATWHDLISLMEIKAGDSFWPIIATGLHLQDCYDPLTWDSGVELINQLRSWAKGRLAGQAVSLQDMSQGKTESVEQFHSRLKQAFNDLGFSTMDDIHRTMLASSFVQGLRESVKKPLIVARPEYRSLSLEVLLLVAKGIESQPGIRKSVPVMVTADADPNRPYRNYNKIKCHNCGRLGHVKRRCRAPIQQQKQPHPANEETVTAQTPHQ